MIQHPSHHLADHEVEQLVGQRVVRTTEAGHGVPAGLGDDARRPVRLPAQNTNTRFRQKYWKKERVSQTVLICFSNFLFLVFLRRLLGDREIFQVDSVTDKLKLKEAYWEFVLKLKTYKEMNRNRSNLTFDFFWLAKFHLWTKTLASFSENINCESKYTLKSVSFFAPEDLNIYF